MVELELTQSDLREFRTRRFRAYRMEPLASRAPLSSMASWKDEVALKMARACAENSVLKPLCIGLGQFDYS